MKVVANTRNAQGTGASRRLRRAEKVPGIIYGGADAATPIEIDHNPLYHALRVEAFHSSILDMELDGQSQRVLLRDVQWHPYKQQILHIDFQRVSADRPITMRVPLHFTGAENSPAVKLSAAIIGHVMTDVAITCLPADLPEFIEVDLSKLETTGSVHMSDIVMPAGVKPLTVRKENPVVVTVTVPAAEEEKPAAAAAAPAKKGK